MWMVALEPPLWIYYVTVELLQGNALFVVTLSHSRLQKWTKPAFFDRDVAKEHDVS